MSLLAADLIDRVRNCDTRAIAEQLLGLRLKRAAVSEYVGPCPACGGEDRFGVNVRKQVWNCRGCGKGGDVIALVMHVEGVSFHDAVAKLAGETWAPAIKARESITKGESDDDERHHHETARWLWSRREALTGSIGERYLKEARAYKGPLPPTLGFLRAKKGHRPVLICAYALPPAEIESAVLADPRDVQSVQLIALKPDGSDKADVEVQKRSIGAHKGLPIVVSLVNDGLGLSIHEGVEDALSAYEATGLGCWASGGATFLPSLADAIPTYVEVVTIIGHQDDGGLRGARELARRLTKKGVEVLLEGRAEDG